MAIIDPVTHASYQRLEAIARDVRGVTRPSDLARALGQSQQAVSNWRQRGVSQAGVLAAMDVFGVAPRYLTHGTGPVFVPDTADHLASTTAAVEYGLGSAEVVKGLAQLLDAMDEAARREAATLRVRRGHRQSQAHRQEPFHRLEELHVSGSHGVECR